MEQSPSRHFGSFRKIHVSPREMNPGLLRFSYTCEVFNFSFMSPGSGILIC